MLQLLKIICDIVPCFLVTSLLVIRTNLSCKTKLYWFLNEGLFSPCYFTLDNSFNNITLIIQVVDFFSIYVSKLEKKSRKGLILFIFFLFKWIWLFLREGNKTSRVSNSIWQYFRSFCSSLGKNTMYWIGNIFLEMGHNIVTDLTFR